MGRIAHVGIVFESFVNSEECKTVNRASFIAIVFESFVNSEECKQNVH